MLELVFLRYNTIALLREQGVLSRKKTLSQVLPDRGVYARIVVASMII